MARHAVLMRWVSNNMDSVKETSFSVMPHTPAGTKRPFGVNAIIVLLVLRLLTVTLEFELLRSELVPMHLPGLSNEIVNAGIISVIAAGIAAICIGLFLLKRWAWIATMILIGSNLLFAIASYFNGGQPFAAMLLDVLSVFYLNQQGVQAAFERRPTAEKMAQ